MKAGFPYTSVHEYLTEQFGHINYVSDTMVREAKAQYWKLYRKYYKATYKENYVQISITFTKDELKELRNRAKSQDVRLTTLIKSCLSQKSEYPSKHLNEIQQGISKSLDYVEEAVHEHDVSMLYELQTLLESIHQKLSG